MEKGKKGEKYDSIKEIIKDITLMVRESDKDFKVKEYKIADKVSKECIELREVGGLDE